MKKQNKRTYSDRTIELIKTWESRDISTLESAIVFMGLGIRRARSEILELEKGIIELYEDINTIDFLISNKKNAK